MRCGLYGKLPARRDFVAAGAPRAFLRLWEPWLEAVMKEARALQGESAFAAHYHRAPIWRFWLGPAVCGEAFVGALMASVDALGRMYPLTLMGFDGEGRPLAPPTRAAREAWFHDAEALLLDALDPEAETGALLGRLKGLSGDAGGDDAPGAAAQALAALAPWASPAEEDEASVWWTIGGENVPPLALAAAGLPQGAAFSAMFGPSPQAADESGVPRG
ncbi:type VI secretion system-associated protein TagF [Methylocella sp.]|uniref:type VI secretion system-associated protein TagF n=1 Tax=Methylocella sp. TaxID=1978226 RepID=UPI003784A0DE